MFIFGHKRQVLKISKQNTMHVHICIQAPNTQNFQTEHIVTLCEHCSDAFILASGDANRLTDK